MILVLVGYVLAAGVLAAVAVGAAFVVLYVAFWLTGFEALERQQQALELQQWLDSVGRDHFTATKTEPARH